MPRSRKAESSRVAAALAEWRQAHPAATLLEIEEAVDRFLRDERAALIADTAQLGDPGERPDCPRCGRPMHRDGTTALRRTTAHDGELVVEGQAWRCPDCDAGLFPPG